MWNKDKSIVLSITVCFIFLSLLSIVLFLGPWVANLWFDVYRGFDPNLAAIKRLLTIFVCSFYPCAVFGYITLYSLIRLLFNIRQKNIFINKNVVYLRRISWCCFAVSLITLIAGVFYIPYCFISVAAAFIGLMLRVVKNVMQNAVEIKTENELTI